jgi:DNA invertase Pin-like site-specific DNA recombinase
MTVLVEGVEYQGKAISYERVSTGKQVGGRGLGRQDDGATNWCKAHSYYLDTSFSDPDMSAFHGKNATEGELSRIVQLAEARTWQPGTILIVEHVDRLSRADIDEAQILFRRILDAGLEIVTLMDGQHYTLEKWKTDLASRMMSLVHMALANEESRKKQARLKDVWADRRAKMREGKPAFRDGYATKAAPAWLRVEDGRFVIDQAKVAVIERIAADRYLKLGKAAIATRLNTIDPVAAFRGGGKLGGWHPATVEKLVKNLALRGIYQPYHADGTEAGEPIADFYPRIMTDADWHRMQWPVNGVKASPGKKTAGCNNLLQGVCKCHCGATLVYVDKGPRGGAFLACSKARRRLCDDRYHHTYRVVEATLLDVISVTDPAAFIVKASDVTPVFHPVGTRVRG